MFITDNLVTDLIITVVTLVIGAYFYIKHKYSYWTNKGIPQIPPIFPFGNFGNGLPKGVGLGAHSATYYDEFKRHGHKLGGVYLGLDPYLVLTDVTYAKHVFSKDFSNFVDRGVFHNKNNPFTVNILTQGGEEWRIARAKFTSIFTSAKMKYYFNTVKKCSDELKTHLELITKVDNVEVDIYEVMACYLTDVLGSITFGVDANSFKSPDAIFRKLGRHMFETFPLPFQIELFLTICYPKLAKLMNLSIFQPELAKFYGEFVPETMEHRIKNNIHRADFLELLIEMKNSGIDLSQNEIVAQSFGFFTAGFETSATAAMLLLYELSKNRDIQKRVRTEINEVLKKHGDFTYDAINEMTYLSQVLNETMRKYPLLATLNRVCEDDYKFPDTDVIIEKGTPIIIPVLGFHRDPSLFPDPEKFDPDRFKDKNVKHDGYFPFGDGPRNCIGGKLGILQVKLGLAEVIKNYEVSLSPKVKEPLVFDTFTFATKMTEKVLVKLKKIN
ncbi:unnamed protein product [Psylliodes chrysocephalus]|uniref:Cytochrome P450 n=1 Tax=Psylliodes chrysocephalus TaxID=3402493 RepID=A0A9P0GNW9_9CUCU|nr:unnamed protein product [Psylliodes chrysocephala]